MMIPGFGGGGRRGGSGGQGQQPPREPNSTDAKTKKKSGGFFGKAMGILKDATKELKKGVEQMQKDASKIWNQVKAECPRCKSVITFPEKAETATCMQCGETMLRPSHKAKANYHVGVLTDALKKGFKEITGDKKVPMTTFNVVVPEGRSGGDDMRFMTPDGRQFDTKIPAGLTPGSTFPISVPAIQRKRVVKAKALPVVHGVVRAEPVAVRDEKEPLLAEAVSVRGVVVEGEVVGGAGAPGGPTPTPLQPEAKSQNIGLQSRPRKNVL